MQKFSRFRGYAPERGVTGEASPAPCRIRGHGSWLLADDSLDSDSVRDLLSDVTDHHHSSPEISSQLRLKEGIALLEHQKAGVQWMREKEKSTHSGGILADEMGYSVFILSQS
jgi:SNF2 family DNA or RNA helicase